MKIRFLLALVVGLAISFAVATFAQQPNTPDPKLHEAFATLLRKVDDGFVNSDAAAIACIQHKSLINSTQLRGYNEGL